jgi:hypothetical protein
MTTVNREPTVGAEQLQRFSAATRWRLAEEPLADEQSLSLYAPTMR